MLGRAGLLCLTVFLLPAASAQLSVGEPTAEVEVDGPEAIVELKPGPQVSVDVDVRLLATNYVCEGDDHQFPIAITVAWAHAPGGFEVRAPTEADMLSSGAIMVYPAEHEHRRTITLNISYNGDAGEGDIVPVTVAAWFAGGPVEGCTAAGPFPASDDSAIVHIRLPEGDRPEQTATEERGSPSPSILAGLTALALAVAVRRRQA